MPSDLPHLQTVFQNKLAENFLFHYFEVFWLYFSSYRSACMTLLHEFILCLLYKLRFVLILSQVSHHLFACHKIFICVSRNCIVISPTVYFEIHSSFICLWHQENKTKLQQQKQQQTSNNLWASANIYQVNWVR